MERQTPVNKRPMPPVARFALAGVAIGLSYIAVSAAIDSGSLLMYTAALILFALGIKDLVVGVQAFRRKE